jgi:hypothetical protein
MLTIKNIDSLKDTYVGHWKIRAIGIEDDYYIIKVVHLMIERQRTSHGDYTICCYDTNKEHHIPIECIRDREEFVRFLIDELT